MLMPCCHFFAERHTLRVTPCLSMPSPLDAFLRRRMTRRYTYASHDDSPPAFFALLFATFSLLLIRCRRWQHGR